MTIYQAAYLACLTFGFWMVSRNGDIIDRLHAYSVVIPIALWLAATAQDTFDPLPIIGVALLLHGLAMLYFPERIFGVVLGLVSTSVAMLAAVAMLGLLPSAKGQGIAHNFYHYATLISYIQIGAMWGFGLGSFFRRPLV